MSLIDTFHVLTIDCELLGSSIALEEDYAPLSPPPESVALTKKISMAIMKAPPTIVHRTQFKSRPSLISLDKAVLEIMPDALTSTLR